MLALNFSGSAGSSLITGSTTVTGSGEQSPTNPYTITGVTDGVPYDAGVLYGDGVVNDSYDPSTGKLIRYWQSMVLDSSVHLNMAQAPNDEGYTAVWVQSDIGLTGEHSSNIFSTHFKVCKATDLWYNGDLVGIALNNQRLQLRFPKSIATDLNSFYVWLDEQKAAGTPVTVVYPIAQISEEYISDQNITFFNWGQSNVTYDIATAVGVSSAVKVNKNTVHLYGTPVSQFNVLINFINNGRYFVLQQGNTYKFSIALEAQSSQSYKKLNTVMLRLFLSNADGSDGGFIDQPGYIDGDKVTFEWKYTAEKGSYCKTMKLQFTADNYYTEWDLVLKKGQVEIYDPNKELADSIGDKLDEQTEKQKGFFERLGDRIKGFFDDLLEGIKNLFIPSGEYISEFFSDWNTWFADHFGILYYPFEFFIDILTRLLNLNIPDNPSITFPGVSIMGYTLWDDTTYSFDLSALPALAALHETYYIVVDVIVIVSLVHFAKKKLDSIMSGG